MIIDSGMNLWCPHGCFSKDLLTRDRQRYWHPGFYPEEAREANSIRSQYFASAMSLKTDWLPRPRKVSWAANRPRVPPQAAALLAMLLAGCFTCSAAGFTCTGAAPSRQDPLRRRAAAAGGRARPPGRSPVARPLAAGGPGLSQGKRPVAGPPGGTRDGGDAGNRSPWTRAEWKCNRCRLAPAPPHGKSSQEKTARGQTRRGRRR